MSVVVARCSLPLLIVGIVVVVAHCRCSLSALSLSLRIVVAHCRHCRCCCRCALSLLIVGIVIAVVVAHCRCSLSALSLYCRCSLSLLIAGIVVIVAHSCCSLSALSLSLLIVAAHCDILCCLHTWLRATISVSLRVVAWTGGGGRGQLNEQGRGGKGGRLTRAFLIRELSGTLDAAILAGSRCT